MAVYIGKLIIDPSVVAKLNSKHQVTEAEVREAFEWPAQVDVAAEDHLEHGYRWVGIGSTAEDRMIIITLLPAPEWEWERADTWVVKTARWV